ncbi:MAG: bifunctional diguanylate cyclase/phosphodiesterase [Porticoccaceae bacterium]|nr:bifunctional diguanylate cyclase/phosphodiesterase [Porticoccaceae bacterium]
MSFESSPPANNYKTALYQSLLEHSPFGTLVFVYGVCVECNPRAEKILACERRALLGSSLLESPLDESLALITLKQELNTALEQGVESFEWHPGLGHSEESLDIRVTGNGVSEIIVTLLERQLAVLPETELSEPPVKAPGQTSGVAGNVAEPEGTETVCDATVEPDTLDVDTVEASSSADPVSRDDAVVEEQTSLHRQDLAVQSVIKKAFAPDELDSRSAVLEKLAGREIYSPHHPLNPDLDRDIYFDTLTQLPNRQLLIENLRDCLASGVGESQLSALLLVDLDQFKDINDSWGHDVGDRVLFKLGRVIAALVDENMLLARISGDEFVLLVKHIGTNPEQAMADGRSLAEKIQLAIAQPVSDGENEFSLTASVGIALLDEADLAPDRALQYAETAMYEAKRMGRNGIAFYDRSIGEKAQQQIVMNTRLRKALDNQEFALYVQPKIAIDDGRVVGGEALLRWINTDRVTNMPAEFIPLLEASGLIVDVGHWVIRTACEYVRSFLDGGLWGDNMQMSVNISPRQFNDPELFEVIEHSLRSYEVDPKYLNFEVTENLIIEDIDAVIKKMLQIKALGSKFSIDDFGIGYSSMVHLKRLPFDLLKIDREFIRNIHNDPDSRGVVEAILAVSRQYGLHVTAEGVEDLDSLEVLRTVGCDTYQGAYFSMPVPVEQFRSLLAA